MQHEGKKLVPTPTGIKIGVKGKVQPAGAVLALFPKPERRKVRKWLHKEGFRGHAGAVV